MSDTNRNCVAFSGEKRIASGELQHVAMAAKAVIDGDPAAQILIFDDMTSEPIDLDWRGTADDVVRRLAGTPTEVKIARPGRPKLGVVAREVTLLPRHWEWLASQPGGASVTLRKLVDQARRDNQGKDRLRHAEDAAYRFLSAMAGNLPGFEEALRALFAGDQRRFGFMAQLWPADVRDHALRLAARAFIAADSAPPNRSARDS